MNIYMRELRAHRKSLIIWSVSMFVLIISGMSEYSASMGGSAGGYNDIIKEMPKSLQNIMGIGVLDLSKALDYFGLLFLYIALLAGIHSVMLGTGIISKEERDKTAEFLMVKPLSRNSVITSKLFSALTIVVLFNIATFVSAFYVLLMYSKDEPFMIGLSKLMLAMFALQLFFLVLGTFFAAIISKPKLSSAVGTGVLLMMFMVSTFIDVVGKTTIFRFATIFKYFEAKDILHNGYSMAYPMISGILMIACIVGTYYFYKRRDLRI